MYRCQRIGKDYLNNSLIPALCRKAGIPEQDARGDLTSHRARSTIASQLANARDPMSLFELMEWLGHKSPQSTVHYVKSSLANQVKQYEAAGYRDRNLRSIAVLVNRRPLTARLNETKAASTMTWAMDIADTNSSPNARTAWRVSDARSTSRKTHSSC